jgi:hypothetical protein
MNIPKFTAEVSLYRSANHYGGRSPDSTGISFSGPIAPAYYPGPEAQAACYDCGVSCNKDLGICVGFASAGLLGCFWPPACAAAAAAAGIAIAVCNETYLTCMGLCAVDDCCPKLCGDVNPFDPGWGCCDEDENCADGCCPKDNKICGGKCCSPGDKCCGDGCCPADFTCQQGVCCQPGEFNCAGACCQKGFTCEEGLCCPPGNSVCKGKCCHGVCDQSGNCCESPDNYLCGGECCFGAFTCCNNKCLTPDLACVNDKPCPQVQACGNLCCPPGKYCQDPSSGTCGVCSEGKKAVVCGNNTNAPRTACCPPNVNCCNGKCCPSFPEEFGDPIICCKPVSGGDWPPPLDNTQFGCHHASRCIS